MQNNIQKDSKNELSGLNIPTKILSICIPGRDDNYFLDFKYRINTTINHLARSINNLSLLDSVEILITDWGSPIPISQTLELSLEASKITRFIYVEPEIIREVMQNGNDDWHIAIPPNVAARRAKGKYILTYPADTLISQYSFETLIRFLNGKIPMSIDLERSYFLIPRYDVPWQFLERQPNLEEWNRYFSVCSKNTPLEQSQLFSFFGDAGGFLMHHSLWYKFRGFDELNYEWGANDVELGMRVTQYYPQYSMSSIGIFLYHMGHPPLKGNRVIKEKKSRPKPTVINTSLYVNDENWGLGNIEFDLKPSFATSHITNNRNDKSEKENNEDNPNSKKITLENFHYQINSNDYLQNLKVALSYPKDLEFNKEDLNSFFLIAWYSHFYYPQRYLEFYTGRTPATGITAIMCPSVEIFKADLLQGVVQLGNPFNIGYIYGMSPYKGYLRIINGDIQSAVSRLLDSFVGTFTFDLGFIKLDTIGEDFEKHIPRLLPHLAYRGALVFNSSSPNHFKSMLSLVQVHFPHLTLITCADNRTGMIFANSIIKDSQNINLIEGISFDTSWVPSLLFRKKIMKLFKPIIIKWLGLLSLSYSK